MTDVQMDPDAVFEGLQDIQREVINALIALQDGAPDLARESVMAALSHTNLTLAEFEPDEEEVHDERVRTYDRHGEPHDDVLRTASGKVLTEQEIQRLSEEAEQ